MQHAAAAATRSKGRVALLSVLRGTGFALAGLIHLAPLAGVLGGEALDRLYGLRIEDAGLALLLRHRALLFGLLGVLLIGAIRIHAWRVPALVAGAISAVAFLLLAGDPAAHGEALQRVIAGDVVAVVALTVAAAAHVLLRNRGSN